MEVFKKKKGNILSKNVSQKRKVMHKEKINASKYLFQEIGKKEGIQKRMKENERNNKIKSKQMQNR